MKGGSVRITSSSAVLSSRPTRVFGMTIESDGVGNGTADAHDGTDATGDKLFDAEGEVSKTKLIPGFPAEGVYFPNGLFVVVGANANAVTVFVEADF